MSFESVQFKVNKPEYTPGDLKSAQVDYERHMAKLKQKLGTDNLEWYKDWRDGIESMVASFEFTGNTGITQNPSV